METGLFAKIRSNFGLLTFLSISIVLVVLWWLLMGVAALGGGFQDPSQLAMNIFMIGFFPLLAAPAVAGLAMLIVKLLNLQGVGCLIFIVLGFVIPLVAIVLVFMGQLIARKLYTGDPETMPDYMPKFNKQEAAPAAPAAEQPVVDVQSTAVPPTSVSGEPAEKLAKLKDMLDRGLISQQDYEAKKAQILSSM